MQEIRSKPKASASKRERVYANPLDHAKGFEIRWNECSELFEAARSIRGVCYVYFLGEGDDGPLKIGKAKDPIARLRTMQTGNSRRLRLERILVGDKPIERLMQEMWSGYAIQSAAKAGKFDTNPGTEWFEPEIREELFPVLETASKKQADFIRERHCTYHETEFERCVREAHGEHDIVAYSRDETRVMTRGAGYTVLGRTSVI